jgi:hypothetical protein
MSMKYVCVAFVLGIYFSNCPAFAQASRTEQIEEEKEEKAASIQAAEPEKSRVLKVGSFFMCVFRAKDSTDSGRKYPLIPDEALQ